MGTASFDRPGRLPSDALHIGSRQSIEAGQIARFPRRMPGALEQQVVQAEGEVESRVSVPGAFSVEKQWTARTAQQILGTDVAVYQRPLGGKGGARQFG